MNKPIGILDRSLPSLISRSALAVFPVLLALAALSLMGCMTDSDSGKIRTSEYTLDSIGLRIVYPANWQAKPDQIHGNTMLDLVLLGQPINGFSPNLTVITSLHSEPTLMAEITVTDRADDFAVNAEVRGIFNGIFITPK